MNVKRDMLESVKLRQSLGDLDDITKTTLLLSEMREPLSNRRQTDELLDDLRERALATDD